MAKDHSLPLRQAILTALNANGAITAIVGARCYGEKPPSKPVWPFIKCGTIVGGPFDATCLSGMEAIFNVSGFATGPDGGNAYALGLAIQQALDGIELTLTGGAHSVSVDWTSSEILRDPHEADGYYSVVSFRAVTSDDF